MARTASKVPVTQEKSTVVPPTLQPWQPLESLHREIDRLFGEFGRGWSSPGGELFGSGPIWQTVIAAPAVDVTEDDKAYEVTAELPGMDEKNIEVNVADGSLTIKGEKKEEMEEKKKDYYLRERHFGSFQRSFALPKGVDANKIEAAFKKGVLTVTLPKTAEAQKSQKKIEVKAS
jgi:HSP20 family protein